MKKQTIVGALVLTVFGTAMGCGDDGILGGGFLITPEDEVQLGQGVDQQIEQEYIIVADSDPVAQWARELTQGLVAGSVEFRDPETFGGYKVEVLWKDDLVNAFAAPGGFTYLSTGLILESDTCAEVAGVMGHELAHVTQRHGVKALEAALGISLLADIVFGEGSIASTAAQTVWAAVQNTQFSQDDESEADEVGLQIAHAADYNPYALAVFFQKLLALEEAAGGTSEVAQFFSSHPPSEERSANIVASITEKYPGVWTEAGPEGYACQNTTLTFEQVKAAITAGSLTKKPGTGEGPPPEEPTTEPTETP